MKLSLPKKAKAQVLTGADVLPLFQDEEIWLRVLLAADDTCFEYWTLKRAFAALPQSSEYWTWFFSATPAEREDDGLGVPQLMASWLSAAVKYDQGSSFDLLWKVAERDGSFELEMRDPFQWVRWISLSDEAKRLFRQSRHDINSSNFYYELYRAVGWALANFSALF